MIHYNLTLIFSPNYDQLLLLEKRSGPYFLIGKWCAIGGKNEVSEDSPTAASREILEECGLVIPPSHLTPLCHCHEEDWLLDVFFTTSDLSGAKTLTHEPIMTKSVEELMSLVAQGSPGLSPDLGVFIALALQKRFRPVKANFEYGVH